MLNNSSSLKLSIQISLKIKECLVAFLNQKKKKFLRSYVSSVDGNWGGLVDAESNSFDGMIGMIQRKVIF
jgi:hypothetical protein